MKAEQALHFAESLARGNPNRKTFALTALSDKVRELTYSLDTDPTSRAEIAQNRMQSLFRN
jgi:hypothetical protein